MTDEKLIAALKDYKQADDDGVMVLVSRQALDDAITALSDQRPRLPEQLPDPMFYAYRYHDCIRFNSGGEVNGGKPIEAIPLYTADQVIALLPTPEAVKPERESLVDWFEREWGRHPNEWIRQSSTPAEGATREMIMALLRKLDERAK